MSEFSHVDYMNGVSEEFGRREASRMKSVLARMPFCALGTSPIETMFGCALYIEMESRLDVWAGVEESAFSVIPNDKIEDFVLAPVQGIYAAHQVQVGQYRVDFVVALRSLDFGTGFFAVELDGHDFHEKTKEQASRDKARDRYLQSRGIAVFRFTGSEVWKDPAGCASSLLDDAFAAMAARNTDK